MLRAAIEFLLIILMAMVARAVLKSIFRGISQASANAFQQTAAEAERRRREAQRGATATAGVLHKDPVCGTYVAESTPFKRTDAGETVYFCSNQCREAFTPVPR